MATLFVRHEVKDFSAWKEAYDAFDTDRKSMGVKSHGAYQAEDNANSVTAYHHFDSMDEAKAFVGSTRLKEAMEKAGVVGTPEIWFTNRV